MTHANENTAAEVWLRKLDQLHSSPAVALRILEITRDASFDIRQAEECLASDPALAAKVLRVVNSARYGLARNVANVRQAVLYLGQRSLRILVMSFGLADHLTRGAPAELFEEYWRSSLTLASLASRLAERSKNISTGDAYAAGLLADLGILAAAQVRPGEYLPLFAEHAHSGDLVEAERQAFGFGHPTLGAELLVRWNASEDLTSAIRSHHDRTPVDDPLGRILQNAALLSESLWKPRSPLLAAARQRVRDDYGIDTDGFIDLAVECRDDVISQQQLFAIHLNGAIDCEAIREQARRRHAEAALETALDLDSMAAVFDPPASPR